MMHSIPLVVFALLLGSSNVLGLVTVQMPQIVLTMRSSSPDTNTHDLLSDTLVKSNAYFRDYFNSYYNATKSTLGFSHVSVSTKTYGIQATSLSTRFQTAVLMNGNAYYRSAGETTSNVKTLVEFALNDQNRYLFIDSFLRVATNSFLQSLTVMEVTVDGVLIGSKAPPLPSTQPPATTTSTNTGSATATVASPASSSAADAKKKAGISSTFVVLLVIAALVAFFVIRRRRQNRRYYSKQMVPPPPASSATRHYGSHPAFSFARRSHPDLDSAITYAHSALGSPSAMRADRDEELAPHHGGRTSKNRFHFDIDGEDADEDERTEEWKVIT